MRPTLTLAPYFLAELLALLLSPALCHADEMVATAQVRPIIEWVERHTNLMLLPRPKIYVSREALLRIVADSADTGGHERIAAYRQGSIFINGDYWVVGNVADESVLVHELVHYAQDIGEKHYACPGQREAEAYRLQNLFLLEHRERLFLDWAEIRKMDDC